MKLYSSRFLFICRFFIIDLFSSLLLVCSHFIIISWFSLDKLYVSSNLSISSSHQICWWIGVQKGNKRTDRGTRGQISNIHWIIEKAREFQKKHKLLLYWLCQSLWLCRSQQTVEILKEVIIPDHLTYLLRNLYTSQEATVKTRHGTGFRHGTVLDMELLQTWNS